MPQNPLEVLKGLAMRNVPKPTPQQEENRDLRATAIQEEQDPFSFKSIGRNALDALTQGLTGDPFAEGAERSSMGGKLGMMAAAAPMMPKKLPIISPEAYNDVKAGGLRLYSRLTDAFAKAPNVMKPAKALSIAQQGASKEEIGLRKLNEFLKGRPEMADIPREEIMTHLSNNPLELEVARKGGPATSPKQAYDQFIHEMDTKYGPAWHGADSPLSAQNAPGSILISPEESARLTQLREAGKASGTFEHGTPEYSFLQTPGPSENYGESLIKLPQEPLPYDDVQLRDMYYKRYGQKLTDQGWELGKKDFENTLRREQGLDFTSGHFTDDPNTLVWSRHNDRFLQGTPVAEQGPGWSMTDVTSDPQSKGRFIEEIQSDWHQQGREHGYKTPDFEQQHKANEARREELNRLMMLASDPAREAWSSNPVLLDVIGRNQTMHDAMESYSADPDFYAQYLTPEHKAALDHYQALRAEEGKLFNIRNNFDYAAIDAPYKDTYHELALKQQLLDAANDPSLEWLGVADAETNRLLEGHSELREGTRKWYDEKHPSALEKLLKPLGGDVKFDNLPPNKNFGSTSTGLYAAQGAPRNTRPVYARDEHVADAIPTFGRDGRRADPELQAQAIRDELSAKMDEGWHPPGPGMWKANLTPELKELIKTRGFPAMAAILGLKTAIEPNRPE